MNDAYSLVWSKRSGGKWLETDDEEEVVSVLASRCICPGGGTTGAACAAGTAREIGGGIADEDDLETDGAPCP